MSDAFVEYREHAGTCAACGNSPTNHVFACVCNTAAVVISTCVFPLQKNRMVRYGEHLLLKISDAADAWNARLMHCLGIVRFGDDPNQSGTYRSQVIWEEARARGIPMQQIFLFNRATDLYRARVRGRWVYFKSIPIPPEIPQDAYLWIDDKFIVKNVLRSCGIPVPLAASVCTHAQAHAAFEKIGAPVVVKPRAGSRGRHTTIGVRSSADLDEAYANARQLCRFVSIERYLAGSVCRATLVMGELVGFFQADAPCVVGDGISSIAALIQARNARKPERVQDIVINSEHEAYLRRQGYSLTAVPEKGRIVMLTHRTGRLFGGETRELLSSVHPQLRAHLERAARALGNAPVVGFDLIIPNPEMNPDTQKWGIIEANSLPFIDLHYLPLYGEPSHPAAAVWDLWEQST